MNDQLLLSPDEYRAVVRGDFASFVERSFRELNPSEDFISGEYIELLASALDKVRAGKTKRLIINLPPRTLKSHAASVAFPAFLLGHDPTREIICACYGQDLSDKHARDCRTLMDSQFYRELFPKTAISVQRRSINDFSTTAKGFRLSTSVSGVLTGRGADIIILDDPLKPDDALSETRRKATNDWYFNTVLSRLNSKENGAIIIVMQRLYQQDLVGEVIEREDWTILSLPSIAVDDENYPYETPFGPRVFRRRTGAALHPERDSVETYKKIRDAIGEYNYQSQYQQDPNSLEGGVIKREWIRYYTPEDGPKDFEYILQSWDTASKAGETNDYSVCTTWGLLNGRFYLLDVLRQRLTFPQLKRAVAETFRKFDASKVLIEDKASGIALLQELQSEGVYCVAAYKAEPGKDKYIRLATQSIKFENGRVYVPSDAPWLKEYLREITGFPGAKHDDQVDSTAQALEVLGPMATHVVGTSFAGFNWGRESC